ncbi:MAG: hypothetical protein WKF71_04605 [Pyrinomonadaceae bacterium]
MVGCKSATNTNVTTTNANMTMTTPAMAAADPATEAAVKAALVNKGIKRCHGSSDNHGNYDSRNCSER